MKLFARICLVSGLLLLAGCSDQNDEPKMHPDDWANPASGYSHLAKIAESGIQVCKTCHGSDETNDYNGGSSGVSCYQCHESGPSHHPDSTAWTSPDSAEYHGRVFWNNGWDFSACQNCHGIDFADEVSCKNCHSTVMGIGACTTCHGDPETGRFYPPKDIFNRTDSSLVSIGAHEAHIESEIASIECEACHNKPSHYLDEGHLGDDNIAEVEFGTVATDSSTLSPTWSRSTASCSDVYCHGSFSFAKSESANQWGYAEDFITGNNSTFTWTDKEDLNCTSCHNLPPNGHIGSYTQTECYTCHRSVVDVNGNIIDKAKHINGQANLN